MVPGEPASSSAALLAEASDPRTPPARLTQLAAGAPADIRKRIAANPNLPVETFLALAAEHAAEAFSNPVFELYCLQDPAFLEQLPDETRLAAAAAAVPLLLFGYLFDQGDPYLHRRLAANPHTPPTILRALAVDIEAPVRQLAASNPATPPEWLALLVRAGSQPSLKGWQEAWGELSIDELRELRESGVWGRCLVARHPQTPAADLSEMLDTSQQSQNSEVREALASRHQAPEGVLARLIQDKTPRVYQAVAANPTTPLSLMPALIATRCEIVYRHLALSPRTPAASLRVLSTDSPSLLPAILDHPNLEPAWHSLVQRIGLDQREDCRLTPPELSEDEIEQLSVGGYRARILVAGHPSTPRSLLRQLLSDPDERVLAALVRNPQIHEKERRKLLYAPERQDRVHTALAASPLSSPGMLSLLAEKANRDVVDILLARPDLTPAHCLLIARQSQFIALILARRGHEPAIVAGLEAMGVEIPRVELQWRQQQNWLREQASLPDPHRRQVAAADQDTPSEVLLALVDDPDEWVMIGLESNPMLPPEVERKMREKGRVPRSRSPG